jgi:glutamate racemase
MNQQPIGMLDSGVGGLSVLREVRTLLPAEHVIYVADQGHLPYGPRPREELRGFVEAIARYLIERGCKLLVIPCNAANAAALHYLRDLFPLWPIVGMEPAIKPAAEHTKTGVIGVITTKATFQGELFASVIDRFAQNVQVETQVCPDFVTVVERGMPDPDETREIVAGYLAPLKAANIDALVIGCTHFPFLNPYLQEYLGDGVAIIDPAPAVARQVKRVLTERGLINASSTHGTTEYITTADPDHMRFLVDKLIAEKATAKQGQWIDGRLLVP